MGYTSTEIKRRYNESVYTQMRFMLPIELKDKFKERCEDYEISMRQVVIDIIKEYLEE